MSTIGGELLGEPGTQVLLEDGMPELPDDLTARSWIVADAESGEVLASHQSHWPLAPASTIKMLLADTLLPKFEPDRLYRALPEHFVDMGAGSSAVGIADHQTYTVEDLWYGVFLASGNDAVYALVAMNGGKEKTVEEMNERAYELQAMDTKVINPDGYDAKGQRSSAYDLTLIARAGLRNAEFRDYAATGHTDFPGAGQGADRETYGVQSTNRLLVGAPGLDPYRGLAGIKNGYTSDAGYTFTGVAERAGRVLLVTCMNPDGDALRVYEETAALFDWGFEAAGRVKPVGELVPPRSEVAAEATVDDAKNTGGASRGDAVGSASEKSGPASTVAVFTALSLALLAGAGYAFHRRTPLPARPSRSAPPR